ncbi:hypothetical protein B0H13DRAFT_2357404 [Mycena leptocephala]|nr:hypothetical protein B0H13DRAFT_2357404 [Mycena leptocephala]
MGAPLYKRGNRLATMIDIGSMLRRFSAHARFQATALSPPSPLSRASTRNDPRHSYVASFSCGRRLSVAPLDLHVEIILMCIRPLCATSHAPPLRSP